MNNLLGRYNDKSISLRDPDGTLNTNEAVIGKRFLDFFRGKVYDLARLHEAPLETLNLRKPNSPLSYNGVDLLRALKEVKNKRCYGSDKLPLSVAKDLCRAYPTECMVLFNNAAKYGLQDCWKVARILPLHKKGPKDDIKNYRPIANLASISKIYEKLLWH